MLDLHPAADMAVQLEAEIAAQMRQPHAQPIDAQIERRTMDRETPVAAAATMMAVMAVMAVMTAAAAPMAVEMEMTVTPVMAVVPVMAMTVMVMTTAF